MHLTRPLHPFSQRKWEKPTKRLRKSHSEETLLRLLAGKPPILPEVGLDLGLDDLPSERVCFGV